MNESWVSFSQNSVSVARHNFATFHDFVNIVLDLLVCDCVSVVILFDE